MVGGRLAVGVGIRIEMETVEEQVEEVEQSGGEWWNGLLYP